MPSRSFNPKFTPDIGKKTRWEPGRPSPNPLGRGGKLKALKDAYKDCLTQIDPDTGMTYAELIAKQVVAKAVKGNMSAVMELANRTEGKPMQPVSLDVGIDDKTAQTIAELATTYKLLENAEGE